MGDSEKRKIAECAAECEMITKKVMDDLIHKNNLFIKSLDDKTTAHFETAEIKLNNHLAQQARYDSFSFYFNIFMWGIMLTIVGWVAIHSINKADKNDVLSLEDARLLIELGDKYEESRYQVRSGIAVPDSTNYHWYLETVFARAKSRGTKKPFKIAD